MHVFADDPDGTISISAPYCQMANGIIISPYSSPPVAHVRMYVYV